MELRLLIAAMVLWAGLAGSSSAAVAVIADTSAASCSQAALEKRADDASLQFCNEAIDQGALNRGDLTRTYVNRGAVLMNRHDYAAARADLERALKLDPSVGDAWMNRGAIEIIERHFADGIVDTTKGLELGVSEPAKAYFNRAVAYEGIDDEKSAYLDYQQALVLKPDWEAPKRELLRFTVSRRPPPIPPGAGAQGASASPG
jgi:tetratricopeptide (TPR) repeat protein